MKTARERLIDYAKDYLKVTCKPNEAIAVTVEQVVGFAELLRAGCHQDIQRLIDQCASTTRISGGKDALQCLGKALTDKEGVALWGLPGCGCDQVDCVYCGPRIAGRVIAKGESQPSGPHKG